MMEALYPVSSLQEETNQKLTYNYDFYDDPGNRKLYKKAINDMTNDWYKAGNPNIFQFGFMERDSYESYENEWVGLTIIKNWYTTPSLWKKWNNYAQAVQFAYGLDLLKRDYSYSWEGYNPDNRISAELTGDKAMYGFDTLNQEIFGPETPDLMASRGKTNVPGWLSDYYYQQMLTELNSRFNNQPRAGHSLVAQANQAVFIVSGVITANNTGVIDEVQWLTPEADLPAPEAGDYMLRLEDGSGNELARQTFQLTSNTQEAEYYSIPLPYFDNAAKLVLLYQDTELAVRTASANRPIVTILEPNGGEQFDSDNMLISWQADDTDQDSLTYQVEYSTDSGTTWNVIGYTSDTFFDVDTTTLAGSSQALVRVLANDGFHTSIDQSDAVFTVADQLPRAGISNTSRERIYVGSQTVILKGYGSDNEDGRLSGESLTWYSNRQREPLGTGETLVISADDLATGEQIISLVATDSAGQSSTANSDSISDISLKVYRNRPIFPAELDISPAAGIGIVKQVGSTENVERTLYINNGGDGDPIDWTATVEGAGNLQLSSSSGQSRDKITLSFESILFQTVGTYSGTITIAPISSDDRAIDPVVIPYAIEVYEERANDGIIYLPLITR
ncbi:hypothetical protein QUF64_08275 [Anaerolineales bacterium HSG6]|nr:hypothetical protein [Anaerolineales bacterium HSG6]